MSLEISVIVPTHNRMEPLRRALRSVMTQTRPPREVIVVDDGSDDEPRQWIDDEFDDVTVLRQPQLGVSSARNNGIAATTSPWIAFLDSDDEWHPAKLERQAKALEREPHRLCHTDEIWIRNGRRVNPKKRHTKRGGNIFKHCLPLCAISPSSVLIERSLLDEMGGFDEDLPVCEDYDLWLRICARYPVLFVGETLVTKHGGHDDQLSRRYWGMDRFRIQALEKILMAGVLEETHRQEAIRVLLDKIDVYLQGARKRGKIDDISRYESLRRCYEKERQAWQSNTG